MSMRDDDPPLRRPGGGASGGHGGETRPTDDLRAQPFTDDVFSEYHARRKEHGNGRGLMIGVAIGLVAVAGLGLYMWSNGMLSPGASSGPPPLVEADPDPYKVKPENPGGMQVANQDKLVYERVAKGETAEPRVENLLPAPEQPKAPPRPAETAPEPAPAPVAEAQAEPAAPPAQEAATAPAATEAGPEPASGTAATESGEDDLAAAVAAATGGRAPAAAAPPAETQTAAVAPALPEGAFLVQLASARSEEGALSEWSRISGRHKDVLGSLSPAVSRVDLGEKGVFFRLRAGPLADRAAAESLCATLGAQNVGCIVVSP